MHYYFLHKKSFFWGGIGWANDSEIGIGEYHAAPVGLVRGDFLLAERGHYSGILKF